MIPFDAGFYAVCRRSQLARPSLLPVTLRGEGARRADEGRRWLRWL